MSPPDLIVREASLAPRCFPTPPSERRGGRARSVARCITPSATKSPKLRPVRNRPSLPGLGAAPACVRTVAVAPHPVKDRVGLRVQPSTMIRYFEFAQNRAESAILTRPVIVPSADGGVAKALASWRDTMWYSLSPAG